MRVHITATRIDGPNAGTVHGVDLQVNEVTHPMADEMGRHVVRLLRAALADPPPTAKRVDPMDAVFRELFDAYCRPLLWDTNNDAAIAEIARKHGGDAPDVLAARIRAIVGEP